MAVTMADEGGKARTEWPRPCTEAMSRVILPPRKAENYPVVTELFSVVTVENEIDAPRYQPRHQELHSTVTKCPRSR